MSLSKGEFSDTDSDSDDGFNEDMEALKRACQLTGKTPTTAACGVASSDGESDGEADDDLQFVRSIQNRFATPMDMGEEPLRMKPLCTVLPDWSDNDDIEDDYETLRAIQRRFSAYSDGSSKDNVEDFLHRPEQVGATIIDSEKETSNRFVERTNAREGFPNCVDISEPSGKKVEACDHAGGSSDIVGRNGPIADDVAALPLRLSHFPNTALAFVDAIKKNRSCQKLIRSKMMQIEARMEELGKLIVSVRLLKDFQVACKKRTGRALSQKKDHRVQLISVPKLKANMKPNEKNIPASYKGPAENVHVPNYKEALATCSLSFSKEKWSKVEKDNLVKGVKQQFQAMLLQQYVDLLSEADGSYDPSNVDDMMKSITDLEITPERMRLFSPKVNWEQLAGMYVPGRTGAECQARFFNSEDPLINHGPWTAVEDKNLLHIIQERGLSNWIDIAVSLGTNRTPFQCLSRYQRSLNASILKREWTDGEDNQLRSAVETYGESNWQVVASTMEGRTGTQCSNRWLKTLHPARVRSGKWTLEEDKRLKVAATLFGPKSWKKVAKCVPGRTHVQCRERWVNCLDPSLSKAEWTEEEDLKLEEAIAKHGYCWSKVAASIPHRTDNQCWRRWKTLFPTAVPLLQTARKIQKAALISNFVDRESERPALGPNDFRVPNTYCIEDVDPSTRTKKRSRGKVARQRNEQETLSGETSSEVLRLTNGSELETRGRSMHKEGRRRSSRVRKSNHGTLSDNHQSGCPNTRLLDLSDEEEIRESHVNDGNIMRKSRPQKKISGKNVASTSFAVLGDNACAENNELSYPTEEPTPGHPNSQEAPLDAEFGGENVIIVQSAKASKLHPRRRASQTLENVQETRSKTTRQAGMKRQMKRDKKLTDAACDVDLPSLSGSTCMRDVMRAIEAGSGPAILATEGNNTEENKSSMVPGSSSPLDVASSQSLMSNIDGVSVNLEQSTNSDRNTNVQCDGSTADTTNPSSINSTRKRKKSSQVDIGSSNGAEPVAYQCKRRRNTGDQSCSKKILVEEGRSNHDQACGTRVSEVEVGDDVTLAQFLQQIRRKEKIQPPL